MTSEIPSSVRKMAKEAEKLSVEDWKTQSYDWSPETIAVVVHLLNEFPKASRETVAKLLVFTGAGQATQEVDDMVIAIALLSKAAKQKLKEALAKNEIIKYLKRPLWVDDDVMGWDYGEGLNNGGGNEDEWDR